MACLAAKNRARISVKLYLPRERKRRDPRIPWACTMSIIFSTSPCDLFHWLTAIARKPFSRVERRNERAEQSRTGRGRASESRGAGRRARSRYTPQRCLVCQWVTKCTIYPHICVPVNAACRTIPIYKVDRQIQSGKVILAWTDPFIEGKIPLLFFFFQLLFSYPDRDYYYYVSIFRWLFLVKFFIKMQFWRT